MFVYDCSRDLTLRMQITMEEKSGRQDLDVEVLVITSTTRSSCQKLKKACQMALIHNFVLEWRDKKSKNKNKCFVCLNSLFHQVFVNYSNSRWSRGGTKKNERDY